MVDRSPARSIAALLASLAGPVAAGALASGCAGNVSGEPCTTDADCQTSLLCVADPMLSGARCMRPCDEGTRLCADGSVCLALAGGRACYPGGAVAFEDPCVRSLDCEAGTVCPDAVRFCVQACDGITQTCLPMERCVPDDVVGPYCSP